MKTWRMTVDGEVFDIAMSSPGSYSYDWVSGPNAGYGFSASMSDHSSMSEEQHAQDIRTFLAAVDPVTGYIEDEDVP